MKTKTFIRGFTLIELLTVIAIIGILAAIIIPSVGMVKKSSNKAKSRVQFTQWASAIEQFKQEYGFYPFFSGTAAPNVDTAVTLSTPEARQKFVEILTGKLPDGTALSGASAGSSLSQNKRRVSYYSFSNEELLVTGTTVNAVKDAFGNDEIVLVIDYDYNGIIAPATLTTTVRGGMDGAYGSAYSPAVSGEVRAGVVFYSAGAGEGVSDIVTSW